MTDITGLRVLVVGASSGIGRSLGVRAAHAGACVALAARRAALLTDAVADAGGGATAIPCDVRDPAHCDRVVVAAVEALGGLDAVVYGAGVSPLTTITEADAEVWRAIVETNFIGAALVARAAIPHLLASKGRLVLLGSSSVGRPFPGLVPYATSKAAVHELGRGLRNEFPSLRVTTVVVGPTTTGFADGWDPELTMAMFERWTAEGFMPTFDTMTVETMADQIIAVLGSGVRIDEVHVMPDLHSR